MECRRSYRNLLSVIISIVRSTEFFSVDDLDERFRKASNRCGIDTAENGAVQSLGAETGFQVTRAIGQMVNSFVPTFTLLPLECFKRKPSISCAKLLFSGKAAASVL